MLIIPKVVRRNVLNSNNSETNYLYMELFCVDDSNEVVSGFRIVIF